MSQFSSKCKPYTPKKFSRNGPAINVMETNGLTEINGLEEKMGWRK